MYPKRVTYQQSDLFSPRSQRRRPLAGLRLEDAGVGQVRECQLRRTPTATQEMELLQAASGAPRRRRADRRTRLTCKRGSGETNPGRWVTNWRMRGKENAAAQRPCKLLSEPVRADFSAPMGARPPGSGAGRPRAEASWAPARGRSGATSHRPPGRGAGLLSRCPSRRGLFPPLSVANPERGAILGPACAAVVEPGGADVGVAEPVLDASDVGVVLEGVGGGGGP